MDLTDISDVKVIMYNRVQLKVVKRKPKGPSIFYVRHTAKQPDGKMLCVVCHVTHYDRTDTTAHLFIIILEILCRTKLTEKKG